MNLARLRLAGIAFAISSGLTGCGGGGGGGDPPLVATAQVIPLTIEVAVIGAGDTTQAGQITTQGFGATPTFAVTTPPTLGRVALNPSTGFFTYTISGQPTADTDGFVVSASGGGVAASATQTLKLGRDPLFPNQWYLSNSGQDAFSSTPPIAGNDINVVAAWRSGVSGKGVKVGVVDSGLEAAHEDLTKNFDLKGSFNLVNGSNDPTPATATPGPDHGTQVAGIIAAAAFNGKGGRGVAYNASLRGYNFLASNQTTQDFAKSLGGTGSNSTDNDVFNLSAGVSTPILQPFSGTFAAIVDNLRTLRSSRGASFLQSAGNDFSSIEGLTADQNNQVCANARALGVSCAVPAVDELHASTVDTVVGATAADGKKASYSSTGADIWISAPGGEFGLNSTFVPNLSALAYKPAIVTTARTGCAFATFPTTSVNALDNLGKNPFAANCQYTALMNGTSSAAPVTAGVVALMLEANPNLSYRDVKHILARTARKVDPAMAPITLTGSSFVVEQGWVTNAAGFAFNNWYGFGQVDAATAVQDAKTFAVTLPAVRQIGPVGTDLLGPVVPKQSAAGLTKSLSITSNAIVEQVFVILNFTTPVLVCNQIELISPAGTKSILLHAGSGLQNTAVTNGRLLSNAFYGEASQGNWRLSFYDFCPSPTLTILSSTLPQTLTITGR